jgi:hypothetical protein
MRSGEKNFWLALESVVIVFAYKSEANYRNFRQLLDAALNQSKIEKLEIIVSLPVEIKKEDLPPHRLIHFISPKDFNLFGKLKNDLLSTVLTNQHDALIWFMNDDAKLAKSLKNIKVQHRIGVNCGLNSFDIDLKGREMNPDELISFAKHTLQKLTIDA